MKKVVQRLKLADPRWQAIGAIVGIIAVMISTVVAYDVFRRSTQPTSIRIQERYELNPLEFAKGLEGRVKMAIDGQAVDTVRLFFYTIENTGKAPVLPTDFVEPLRISLEDPWQLIAIGTAESDPPGIAVDWVRVNATTMQLVPTLLNPSDQIQLVVFATSPQAVTEPESKDQNLRAIWTARIKNVRALDLVPSSPPFKVRDIIDIGIFHTVVCYQGISVYLLVGLTMLLWLFGYGLARSTKRLPSVRLSHLLLVSTIMLLSLSTSEIIIDALVNNNWHQWGGSALLLVAYLVLLAYLGWPLVRVRLKQTD